MFPFQNVFAVESGGLKGDKGDVESPRLNYNLFSFSWEKETDGKSGGTIAAPPGDSAIANAAGADPTASEEAGPAMAMDRGVREGREDEGEGEGEGEGDEEDEGNRSVDVSYGAIYPQSDMLSPGIAKAVKLR